MEERRVEKYFESSIDILVSNSGGPPPMLIKETNLRPQKEEKIFIV